MRAIRDCAGAHVELFSPSAFARSEVGVKGSSIVHAESQASEVIEKYIDSDMKRSLEELRFKATSYVGY